MPTGCPEILTVTHDLAVAHAVTQAAPEEWTEWSETISSALRAIRPETKLLVFDAAMDGPLSRLLPRLFVDQQPGRRAIVVHSQPGQSMPMLDSRITVLSWPLEPGALAEAMAEAEAAPARSDAA
jgi:hypothetical protein